MLTYAKVKRLTKYNKKKQAID